MKQCSLNTEVCGAQETFWGQINSMNPFSESRSLKKQKLNQVHDKRLDFEVHKLDIENTRVNLLHKLSCQY